MFALSLLAVNTRAISEAMWKVTEPRDLKISTSNQPSDLGPPGAIYVNEKPTSLAYTLSLLGLCFKALTYPHNTGSHEAFRPQDLLASVPSYSDTHSALSAGL